MASSPPGAFPATLPNPKKRHSMSSQPSLQGASKRAKLHPLRNASFPTTQDASAVSSAQSETGSVANSQISTTSRAKGRGRPKKSLQMNEEDLQGARGRNADTGSHTGNLRGGGARVAKSVVSVKSGVVDAEDEDDEEDADQEADLDDNQRTMMLEAQEKDEERSRRLIATFDSDSEERYWKWRALNLDKAVVKRMANQTVSQSIGKTPLLAVHMYAKYFVGEILERAREVQGEYAKAYEKTREMEKKYREEQLERLESKQIGGDMNEHEARLIGRDILRLRKEVNEYIPNPHKGGLLPDHLREALRRYKADGDGGGVGFEGLSHGLLGIQGSAIWRTGDGVAPRRLFR